MAWARSSTTNAFIHNGTDRDFVVSGRIESPFNPSVQASGSAEYQLVAGEPSHQLRWCLFSSEDGRRCIEVGIVNDALLAAIDAATYGMGGTDPASGLYGVVLRADHHESTYAETNYNVLAITGGIGSSQDLVTGTYISTVNDQEVRVGARILDEFLYLRINNQDVGIKYRLTSDDFPNQWAFGFVSHVDNASVKDPSVCALNPVFRSADTLIAIVSNGVLYTSEGRKKPGRKGIIASPGLTPISGAIFREKLYVVDGKNARIYDHVTDAITNWGPESGNDYWEIASEGTLPGAVADPSDPTNRTSAGSTTATIVVTHNARLWLAGMPEDPQEIWASAVDDPGDFFIGSQSRQTRAVQISVTKAGRVGNPVTCLLPYQDDYMLIGMQGEIAYMVGDPQYDDERVETITTQASIIGPDAATVDDAGRVYAMTEQGPALIAANSIEFISKNILSAQIAKGDSWSNYRTKMVRDSDRYGVLSLFFRSGSNEVHFWLDERTQGFFPERYGTMYPSAAASIGDQVWLGSEDGYIYTFDDGLRHDALGTGESAIHSACPLSLIMDSDAFEATRINQTAVVLSTDSNAVDVWFRRGDYPEQAFGNETYSIGVRATAGHNRFRNRIRGGAIVCYIISPVEDGSSSWSVEYVDVWSEPAGLLRAEVPTPVTCDFVGGSGSGSGSGSGVISGSGFAQPGAGSDTGSALPPFSGSGGGSDISGDASGGVSGDPPSSGTSGSPPIGSGGGSAEPDLPGGSGDIPDTEPDNPESGVGDGIDQEFAEGA